MIHSLKGGSSSLRKYCTSHYNAKKDLIVDNSDEFVLSYSIIRSIIPKLRAFMEKDRIDKLLFEHRMITSSVFMNLHDTLTTLEKRESIFVGAQLESNVTHTRVAETEIVQSLADILYMLMKNEGFRIVIPNICFLDEGSLHIIRKLYEQPINELPDLILGYDASLEASYDEKTGLYWFYSLNKTDSQAFYYAFEEKAEKILEVEDVTSDFDYTLMDVESSLDELDPAIELIGHNILKNNDNLDKSKVNAVYRAVCKCFNLFHFPQALRLGQEAISRNLAFSDLQKAEIYTIMGVSSHNLHFFSQGNIVLADYILGNYMEALKYEKDPARRICLYYRIVVVMARRKGDIENSAAYLGKAYEELENNNFNSPNAKASVYSWICNIHSFVLMRQREMEKAIKVHEDAFYLLEKIDNKGFLAFDLNFSTGVLAENLCTLNTMAGDYDKAKFWYEEEEKIVKQWPDVSITSFAEWQTYYFRTLQIDKALEQAKKGLIATKKKYNYILEYFFTMSLADLHYRLGNADDALQYYERALEFESKIDLRYTSPLSLRKGKLMAIFQLGKHKEFLTYVDELIATFKNDESTYNVCSLYALKAIGCAKLNNEEEANNAVNTAIELAIGKGEQNVLFHVAIQAGHTNLVLGKRNEAYEAFNQALEIGTSNDQGNVISNTDMALLYIGMCISAPNASSEHMEMAIRHTCQSLKEDASIWWYLNNLIQIITESNHDMENAKTEFQGLLKAAEQRVDYDDELKKRPFQKV